MPVAGARIAAEIPVPVFRRQPEIANAALFLASDESSYVNGSTFLVDGGITAAYITPE
ncbi:MAG: SDR family oxidoreductase [Acidobacteriota bacterium]